jgi:hypothetical protein
MNMHSKATLAIALSLCAAACGRGQAGATPADATAAQPSAASASKATPTNDASFQLMGAEMPARLAALQQVVVQAGNHCAAATRGLLVGGLDGTDEWRVDCSDSGSWQVWFSNDSGTSVDHCANAKCS